ncbi:protein quaking [Echinococcus multilocularis]|uniref:Protein quaking n=1 Tax=Echinococcus multilocularis TaxID=6211 RepID=A0A087VXC9_ECHMU|nr:protein quaking [Echinococcus multilocularis]
MVGKTEQPETGVETHDEIPKGPSEQFNSSLLQKATPEYLQELLMDKKQLQSMPNSFKHVELILEKEIAQVRERLFHKNGSIQMSNTDLPDPSGQIVTLQRKVYIPVKENPTYNFVGRLLGPRGLTAKQMEQDLGCKIMVRGKGSMRDKRKEDQNRGKPNWEHLQEDLHVLVSVEDYESRAELRLQRAVNAITIFLEQGLRTPEDKDLLKQTQLMELAVLNDKERQQAQVQQMTQQQQHHFLLQQQYLSMLSSQSAIAAAAALAHNPAAQLLAPAGLRFGAPTASTHPSTAAAAAAAAAANPLFLGTNPTPTPVTASTPSAAVAAMNLAAAVMGGVPAISPVTSTATATAPISGAISSDQLAALLGVANGAVSPNSAASSEASGQSMAAIAAGFPGTFPSLLPCTSATPSNPTTGTIIGSYSNAGDLENNSGSLKLRSTTVPAFKFYLSGLEHTYILFATLRTRKR